MTKNAYLEFVSQWKNQYQHLSKSIRKLKIEVRKPYYDITWQEASELYRMKKIATEMLQQRKESKEQAQLMWLMQNGQ